MAVNGQLFVAIIYPAINERMQFLDGDIPKSLYRGAIILVIIYPARYPQLYGNCFINVHNIVATIYPQ